ncbi:MAG: hypothetical protein FWD44_04370 [Oscillospiraceae bacterium]|nr:hypothetical protein [Oscillospiraceae bacterium]
MLFKIFFQESKKILRPVPLLVLALFVGLYGFLFIRQSLTPYERMIAFVDIALLAGTKIDMDELDKLEAAALELEARYIAEFHEAIKDNQIFIDAGIKSYDDYRILQAKNQYRDIDFEDYEQSGISAEEIADIFPFRNMPPFDPEADYSLTPAEEAFYASMVIWDTPSLIKLIEFDSWIFTTIERLINGDYTDISQFREKEYFENLEYWWGVDPAGMERIRKIYANGEVLNILPETYNAFLFRHIIVTILGTLFILLMPVITKDNMSGVRSLQYSSKTGRRTLTIQLAAMLFTAFVIAVVQVTVILGLYTVNIWHVFINTGLHSIFRPQVYNWFAGTYLQYFILVGLLFIVVSFAVTLLVFVFSKLSKNYITMLLSIVPIAAIFIYLCTILFTDPFAVYTTDGFTFYDIIPIPFVEAYICIAMLLLAAIPAGLMLARQKRAEV